MGFSSASASCNKTFSHTNSDFAHVSGILHNSTTAYKENWRYFCHQNNSLQNVTGLVPIGSVFLERWTTNFSALFRYIMIMIMIGIYIALYIALYPKAQSALQHFVGDFARLLFFFTGANCGHAVYNFIIITVGFTGASRTEQNTTPGTTSLTFFRTVCGFFNVPHQCCETGPPAYRPYPRRLESLTICKCHCKGSTFSSVI